MKKIIIGIDGYSGTGKSSTAKEVAAKLDYTYIDSGAMYRAVTYFFLKKNVDISNQEEITKQLKKCTISFDKSSVLLNNHPIDYEIRLMDVAGKVSQVSAIPVVRKQLVEQQRRMGYNKGVVMDGRDIGTVVFPEAELKIFMTANNNIRAERRKNQLMEKGIDESIDSIKKNLEERDRMDTIRSNSPLKKAKGSIEIDTSTLTLNQQVEEIVKKAKSLISYNR